MGLQQAIGYHPGRDHWVRKAVVRVTGTRAGAWLTSKTLTAADRAIYRVTKGRHTVTGFVTGFPVVMLMTTGAKSGKRRLNPLIAVPIGDDLAVIGSNFGRQRSPGWVHNLLANPGAQLTYRETSVAVSSRLADDSEHEQAFTAGARMIPSFRYYRQRVTEREIRVFILTLAG